MAKLVEMLVDAGLNSGFEWPDGFDYCAQDDDGDVLVFCDRKMKRTMWNGVFQWISLNAQATYDEVYAFVELADDHQTAQITKQEYLDALKKAKGSDSSVTESDSSAGVVSVGVLKPQQTISTEVWQLPSMLSEYSRKKESFSLLEKELNGKRNELYKLQEDIRLLCEQQGWRIEPLGL